MLRELDEFGFTDITGLDYAQGSVELAQSVCKHLGSFYLKFMNKGNLSKKKSNF